MSKPLTFALLASATLLASCASTSSRNGPIDVTRYHLGTALSERTTVTIEPLNGASQISPEFQLYADAVRSELVRLGYVPSAELSTGYIAVVGFSRIPRGAVKDRPPVSIGLGGGGFGGGRHGGGVGLGGGVSFGVGGKTHQLYTSELTVRLRRRSDNSTMWEGRAITDALGDQPTETAARLAQALFKGFPGESGVTITVK